MTRRLSMTTRQELIEAVGERYRRANRDGKRQILDEFLKLTGYHRKHAIRVLCREFQPPRAKPGPQRRYNDKVRAALITLWEAADRICGKRLKAVIPTLIVIECPGHIELPLVDGQLRIEIRRYRLQKGNGRCGRLRERASGQSGGDKRRRT